MAACNIDKSSRKYQTLKNMSGISEFRLDSTISLYQNKFGRFPELDELPEVNSEPYLKKVLDIKERGSLQTINTEKLLSYTNASTVEEANITLNKQYKDLNITLTQFDTFTSIDVQHRANEYSSSSFEETDVDSTYNPNKSRQVVQERLSKMQKLFGIQIIPVTTSEVTNVPNASIVKGFIQDGNIYINTDNATIDTPIHELMHIFLGGVRYSNPELYFQLINSIEQLPRYEEFLLQFNYKTRGDANEEIFVQEFSRYLTGQPSVFDNFDQIDQLLYEVYRNIDSFISGKYTIKSISNNIFQKSIIDLSKELQSTILNNSYEGSLNSDVLHRTLANFKEDLLKKDILKQECNG